MVDNADRWAYDGGSINAGSQAMGKFTRGNYGSAVLTISQVMRMRQKYAEGATQGSLAREFQVSVGQVGRIVRGESWQILPQTEKTEEQIKREGVELAMKLQVEGLVALEEPQDVFDLELPNDATGDGIATLNKKVAQLLPGDMLLHEFMKGGKKS